MRGVIAEVFSLSGWYDPNKFIESPEEDQGDAKFAVDYALLKSHWSTFEGHFVATANPKGCLSIFTLKRFDLLCDQLNRTNIDDPRAERYRRIIFGYATDLIWGPDLQNGIPRFLLNYANLAPEALLLVFDSGRADIWNEEQLNQLAVHGPQSGELPRNFSAHEGSSRPVATIKSSNARPS